ncbi:cyclic GMP-AMP synthase-like [Mytilus californianus]|uniref:cyclic GMP-AMP synthase-like n=1 Tax=Mytilus californianus TaxID=6549 RepID=UPI0022465FC5|nr:cyclic GMP-AMP synthase-like [Mytilus californianus]
MAETDTQNMSIALYRYMCQEIIGTEEQVKTIRMLNNIRDYLNSSNNLITITSGSFGDGLEMRGSDLDIMLVPKFIEVSEEVNIHFITDTIYFTMASEDTPPGFTKLRLLHSNDQSILEDCDEFGHDYYFSNASVKRRNLTDIFSCVHGPCVSDKEGIFDFAFCVRSKAWITQANQWITRSNNGWPDYNVKQSIVKHGVLFVPVGVKGSKNEELEWRISFSVGEKFLIYTLTHTQLLCYALMKIILKDVINIDRHCKYLLCSYFMKTVIFWISEEFSTSIWKPENLISCFMRCFRRFIYFVEYSMCPHYFIPKINLFDNKIKGQSQQILLNKLHILNSCSWQCVEFEYINMYN